MFTYTVVSRADVPPSRSGYVIPFRDVPVRILQGFNGPISHLAFEVRGPLSALVQDHRFSLDFALPLGTPVRVAKAGIVKSVATQHDLWYGGLDLSIGASLAPNSIYVVHDDETQTVYSHLAQWSAQVMTRERVEQGQVLALTGLSGWIGPEPHLHFAALTFFERTIQRRTFPVEFDNYRGPLEHKVLMGER